MDAIIAKIPIPVSGLMLALAAAGNLVLQYGTLYKDIFGLLSAVIFVALIAKMIIMPKSLAEGFENPLVASVMPSFSMGMMILSTYIKPYFFSAAYCLWLLGLTVHVGLVICFTRKYILKFDIKKVFPSYFIGYVGFACGSVTAPALKILSQLFGFNISLCYRCRCDEKHLRFFIRKGSGISAVYILHKISGDLGNNDGSLRIDKIYRFPFGSGRLSYLGLSIKRN